MEKKIKYTEEEIINIANEYLRKINLLEYKIEVELNKGLNIDRVQETLEYVNKSIAVLKSLGVDMDSDEWAEVTLGLERLEYIKDMLVAIFYGMSGLSGLSGLSGIKLLKVED